MKRPQEARPSIGVGHSILHQHGEDSSAPPGFLLWDLPQAQGTLGRGLETTGSTFGVRKARAHSLDGRRDGGCVDRPETDEGKPCYAEQQQKKDAKAKAHSRNHSPVCVLLFFGVHGR
jgi:hypothetical protein